MPRLSWAPPALVILVFAVHTSPAAASARAGVVVMSEHAPDSLADRLAGFALATLGPGESVCTPDFGSTARLDSLARLEQRSLLLVRMRDAQYLIRDSSTVARARALCAPLLSLAGLQATLAARQAALGRERGKVDAEDQQIAELQGRIEVERRRIEASTTNQPTGVAVESKWSNATTNTRPLSDDVEQKSREAAAREEQFETTQGKAGTDGGEPGDPDLRVPPATRGALAKLALDAIADGRAIALRPAARR